MYLVRVSLRLGRIDALRWTEHMDECLEKLTEAPEWVGDSLLALLVRSQLILEKASRSPWHNTQPGGGEVAATVPAEFYRKALLAQLQELKQQIPPGLQENGDLTCIDRLYYLILLSEFTNARSQICCF